MRVLEKNVIHYSTHFQTVWVILRRYSASEFQTPQTGHFQYTADKVEKLISFLLLKSKMQTMAYGFCSIIKSIIKKKSTFEEVNMIYWMLSSVGHCIATNSQMALPEWIYYQHLVQTGSTQQHQCGQRQTIPLLVSPTLFWVRPKKTKN